MRPIKDLTRMVTMPFTAVFVVGLCYVINQMTSPANPWWHWVALGMGIATVLALGKGLRTLLVLALAWWVGRQLYRRYGAQAKAGFDAWVRTQHPAWGDVVQAWQRGGPDLAAGDPPTR